MSNAGNVTGINIQAAKGKKWIEDQAVHFPSLCLTDVFSAF